MIKFPTALEIASYNLTELEKYLVDLEALMIRYSKGGYNSVSVNIEDLSHEDIHKLIDILEYRNFKIKTLKSGLEISWESRND